MTDHLMLHVAWKCRTCGCLWRDNFDESVSLFDVQQKSCDSCERGGTRETCDPQSAKQLYDLGLAAGRQEQDQQIAEVCRNCGCQEVGR